MPNLIFGPIYVMLIVAQIPPAGLPSLVKLVGPQMFIGWLFGAAFVLAASRLESIGSELNRYWWGAVVTVATTLACAIAANPEMLGETGGHAGLRETLTVGMCVWNGLLFGGPTQVWIARFNLFGQTID